METLRGQLSELVLLPALAFLLPWSLNYRLQKQLSRLQLFYGGETDLAAVAARSRLSMDSPEVWRRQYRLTRMVDGADPWISLARNDSWLSKNVDVDGCWPAEGPFLATSMHWGTGLWAMRHIRHSRGPVALLMRPESEWAATVSAPMRVYYRMIERIVARSGGAEPIFSGSGTRERVQAVLSKGGAVMAMLDVTQSLSREQHAYEFLGRQTHFASGIINIAVQMGVPIVPFCMSLDYASGARVLHIRPPIRERQTHGAMEVIAKHFDYMVRSQPTAWHLWPYYESFLASEALRTEH